MKKTLFVLGVLMVAAAFIVRAERPPGLEMNSLSLISAKAITIAVENNTATVATNNAIMMNALYVETPEENENNDGVSIAVVPEVATTNNIVELTQITTAAHQTSTMNYTGEMTLAPEVAYPLLCFLTTMDYSVTTANMTSPMSKGATESVTRRDFKIDEVPGCMFSRFNHDVKKMPTTFNPRMMV